MIGRIKRGKYSWLLGVLFLSLFVYISTFTTIAATTIPMKPNPGSYIVDTTKSLSPEQQQWLNALAVQVDQKTTSQLAILIVPTIDGEPIEEYSLRVFREWGIGYQATNKGMLLVVAKDDKKVRIEVGYGLEGAMNDAKAGEILDTYAIPYFKQGKIAEGIVATYIRMAQIVAAEHGVELVNPKDNSVLKPAKEEGSVSNSWLFIMIVLLVILDIKIFKGRLFATILGAYYSGRGSGRGGSGGFGGGSGGGGGSSRGW